jgi:hypothetical protein
MMKEIAAYIGTKYTYGAEIRWSLERDYDIIATIKYLEKEWCRDIDVLYSWVKGHTDRLDQPLT